MENFQLIHQKPPIRGIDNDSFAGFTLKERLPFIIDQIIKDNDFSKQIIQRLSELKVNILHGKIEYFICAGNDQLKWKVWISKHIGKSWFEVPFYFAEAYFYRLILDRINFFQDNIDPFKNQKTNDIRQNEDNFLEILLKLNDFRIQSSEKSQVINYLLFLSLWGNKSDLSQLSLQRNDAEKFGNEFTLIDDSQKVSNLLSQQVSRIDIVLDNSGLELFTDLVLAEGLISYKIVKKVVLHAKAYPTFVSDATVNDIQFLIDFLVNHPDKATSEFGEKLKALVSLGIIVIKDDEYWNSPLHFYELSNEIGLEFKDSDLVVFKGDANYRRLFGDRYFPVDLGLSDVCKYLHPRTLAIRVLKSEIILGLEKRKSLFLKQKDPTWMSNGKYGIIQMIR